MISPNFVRALIEATLCWLLLGPGANLAFASSNCATPVPGSTNTFEIGNKDRTQIVAPGDTICFVSDSDYKTPVLVRFSDTSNNPCGPGLINKCDVPINFTSKTPYFFSLCLDTNCTSADTAKGAVAVHNPKGTPYTPSQVYIALAKGRDINSFVFQGDTIAWQKPAGAKQGVKFPWLWGTGWLFNPCKGQYGYDVTSGSCTVDIPTLNLLRSFTYDCDDGSCSDPIVHMVKASPPPFVVLSMTLGLALVVVFGLLGFKFVLRNFPRRNTV
jgi:hypothetical protein